MLEQEILRDKFESLLVEQRKVAGIYQQLAAAVSDAQLKDQAERTHKDKERHIRLTQRLLEIVQ